MQMPTTPIPLASSSRNRHTMRGLRRIRCRWRTNAHSEMHFFAHLLCEDKEFRFNQDLKSRHAMVSGM